MTQPTPQVLEIYTLLQIAAGALVGRQKNAKQTDPFTLVFNAASLQRGNGHSSRMTDVAETPIRSNGSSFAVRCTLG